MTNIVLLVVDTLRDKELDEKGEKVAPFLNSASQSGLKIDNYRSCASWTAPAHASIFTSMLPSEHGTSTENPYFEEENRLARMMKEKGFHTVCLTENANISKTSGYGSSFDKMTVYSKSEFDGKTWKEVAGLDTEFRSPVHKWLWFWSKSVKTKDVDSMRTFWREFKFKMVKKSPVGYREAEYNPSHTNRAIKRAQKELEEHKDVFLFLNLMPVHDPYTFGRKQRNNFLKNQSEKEVKNAARKYQLSNYLEESVSDEINFDLRKKAYESAINFVDAKIGELYENAPEDTVFLVLGDHGELIGEYEFNGKRLVNHQIGTFKELINVPLILFSKSNFDLEIDRDKMYDHRDISGMISNILGDEEQIGSDFVRAEYFGLKGLAEFSDRDIPKNAERVFKRKSFSIIDNKYKYDFASDGKFLWHRDSLTEEENIDEDSGLEKYWQKLQLIYGHHFDD